MSTPEVKREIHGIRDLGFSQRHRLYGWDLPAVDIDFLLIENSYSKPVALVEYKHENVKELDLNHPSFKAIAHLANAAKIPAIVAIYKADYSEFKLFGLNIYAIKYTTTTHNILSEFEYVSLLYRLRKKALPNDIAKWLHGYIV